METVAEMYITLLPVIVAGSLNMVWCKLHLIKFLERPIDNNRILRDGKRLFGDNKTWKGLAGMAILGILCTVLWGLIGEKSAYLSQHNYLYFKYVNTVPYNILMGLLLGLGYALFELPNSFIKRRMNIQPGKSNKNLQGVITVFFDQADSVIGCVLVLCLVYRMSVPLFIAYIFLGALTHIVLNMLLYFLKLRKNMFKGTPWFGDLTRSNPPPAPAIRRACCRN